MKLTLKPTNHSDAIYLINNQDLINKIKQSPDLDSYQREFSKSAVVKITELTLDLKNGLCSTVLNGDVRGEIFKLDKTLIVHLNENSRQEIEVINSLIQDILPIAGGGQTSIKKEESKKEESTIEKIKRTTSLKNLSKTPIVIGAPMTKSSSEPRIQSTKKKISIKEISQETILPTSPLQRAQSEPILTSFQKAKKESETKIMKNELNDKWNELNERTESLRRAKNDDRKDDVKLIKILEDRVETVSKQIDALQRKIFRDSIEIDDLQINE
ncbi:MAG TPA: hypothetical protein VLE96_02050 [Chlamydiales bacterium]|nr:hypothetical protein [Chlamydiales bacterium]